MELPRYTVFVAWDGIDLGDPLAVEKCLTDGEYDTHQVVVLHPDQIMAEQMGPRVGLGTDLTGRAMDYTTLWCWAALVRTHVTVPEYPLFKQRVLSVEKTKPADQLGDEGEGDGLDPTGPGPVTG